MKWLNKWQFWAVILFIIGLLLADWIVLPAIRWLLEMVRKLVFG